MPNLKTQTDLKLRVLDHLQDEAFWRDEAGNVAELAKLIWAIEARAGYPVLPQLATGEA